MTPPGSVCKGRFHRHDYQRRRAYCWRCCVLVERQDGGVNGGKGVIISRLPRRLRALQLLGVVLDKAMWFFFGWLVVAVVANVVDGQADFWVVFDAVLMGLYGGTWFERRRHRHKDTTTLTLSGVEYQHLMELMVTSRLTLITPRHERAQRPTYRFPVREDNHDAGENETP